MMARVFCLVCLCILSWGAAAQPYPSIDGRFSVDDISGCAPFDVTVTIDAVYTCGACDVDLDGIAGDQFSYQTTAQSQTFTYPQAGTYWLKVLIGTTETDSLRITVVPNTPPKFELYSCGAYGVAVALKDDRYDAYVINYNDGSPEVTVNENGTDQHSFGASTPETVSVRGLNQPGADNCDAANLVITPRLALPAPAITRVEVLDDASVRLEYNAEPHIQYRLGIATNNSTNFQQALTVYNRTVDTVTQVNTAENFYCFQLAAFDPCNNTVLPSAVICTPRLRVEAQNNATELAWSTGPGATGYALNRNAGDGSNLFFPSVTSPYHDTDVNCGVEYCYRLTVHWPGGGQSISTAQCATGFSTDVPSEINNITALVGDQAVTLQWPHDPAFIPDEFRIEKSVGGSFEFLATTTQNAYLDQTYTTEEASCYRITLVDVCGNESPVSPEACPIRLSGSMGNDNAAGLTWTAYTGWHLGVASYTVEKYAADGALLQTFDAGTDTRYVDASITPDHQAVVYRVRAHPVENGVDLSLSNALPLLKDPNLFYPTAFTPNGDNLNDHFTVFGQYVEGFEMHVFNRWGELLFTTTEIQSGWDGTYQGREMPEGTYTFIATITDREGRTFKRSGSVLLLRKQR